jgi:hypothetical protein
MFRSSNTGFQIDFPNGWTASVQWGSITNSDNKAKTSEYIFDSSNAEVWAVETLGPDMPKEGEGEGRYPQEPKGYQSVPEVLAFLNEVSLLGVPEFIKEKS